MTTENTSQALAIRDNSALTLKWTALAIELKDTALAASGIIARVSTPEENAEANAAATELARVLKQVETAREAAKRPIIDYGKNIEEAAKAFRKELEEEQWRLSTMMGNYHQLEQKKKQAAEQAARLEAERLEGLRQAELRRLQDESDAKERAIQAKAEEAIRASRDATNAKERREAEALKLEAERLAAVQQAESHEQLEATQEMFNNQVAKVQAAAAPPPAAAKPTGQTIKKEYEIEVYDLAELVKHHFNLVTITPKLGEIKTLVKNGHAVAGVRSREVVKAGVRLAPERKALDV